MIISRQHVLASCKARPRPKRCCFEPRVATDFALSGATVGFEARGNDLAAKILSFAHFSREECFGSLSLTADGTQSKYYKYDVSTEADDPSELDEKIQEMIDYDGPVIFDCQVDPNENCFPMIPSGKPHNQMILGPEEEEEISDEGKVLV